MIEEGHSVEELLGFERVTEWLRKTQNNERYTKLFNFFSKRENLNELVRYAVLPYENLEDDEKTYQIPANAQQIIMQNNDFKNAILESIYINEDDKNEEEEKKNDANETDV